MSKTTWQLLQRIRPRLKNNRFFSITAVILITGLIYGCGKVPEPGTAGTPAAAKTAAAAKPVFTAPMTERVFEKSISAFGSVRAPMHALAAARIAGTLEKLPVNEGDRVQAGETLLFQVDAENLKQAVEIAGQQLAVADAAIREREAHLEMVTADFNLAKVDYERYTRLFKDEQAVTRSAFELQENRFLKTQAAVRHAEAMRVLAQEQKKQAAGQQVIAAKNLNDTAVTAPVSGVVTKRFFEPGERVAPGDAVFRIENTDILEAVFFLPEIYYSEVETDNTVLQLRIDGRDLGEFKVSYKSAAVSRDLRTFEVRCVLAPPPPGVVSGRMIEGNLILARRSGPGIPSSAILLRNNGPVVFLAADGRAFLRQITAGLETGGYTELLEPVPPAGSRVVIDGQYFLNDNDPLDVRERKD